MSKQQNIHVNILSEEFHRDPFPLLAQIRESSPVYWSEETRHWVLTRYDDVSAGLRDASRFSNQSSETFVVRPDFREHLDDLVRMFSMWAVMKDNPEHKRLRGLINRAFHPDSLGDIHARAHETANWLIDRVHDQGEMDFMNDYAFALPAIIFAEILGMDRAELPTFKAWGVHIALSAGRVDDLDVMLAGQEACRSMAAHLEQVIDDRTKQPKDDFVSYLVKEWREGGKLSLEEVIAQLVLLLAGGHTTTQNVMGHGMLALFEQPERLEELAANPEIMKQAVEEIARFTSPAQCPTRIAACDMELRGRQIAKGEGVMPFIAAANRDPEVFENPDRLDFHRAKNPHLAYGGGIHTCPGAFLARAEIPVAYKVLLERIPGIRRKDPDAPADWNMNLSFRGLTSLPVAWG
ncbi:cytochrome P450 [Pseudenhygromyxa sp. WMMC2535]|uniref:cytochrome P450 n=1 Tax=Pseudenhygromyxa sp. WMMC2535 TaxID=2712867 RepID=UPI00155369CD|nr:cytochrome P450 [Pseudenhygromyxa sp. WMMC2535]NVB41760.1 cytochrome P450 [Pseudenhygromyxa sp. WMMC2535]